MALPAYSNGDGTATMELSQDDDLVMRAEKIVHIMGFRGAVGDRVMDVYRVLQAYETLDQEAADAAQPT